MLGHVYTVHLLPDTSGDSHELSLVGLPAAKSRESTTCGSTWTDLLSLVHCPSLTENTVGCVQFPTTTMAQWTYYAHGCTRSRSSGIFVKPSSRLPGESGSRSIQHGAWPDGRGRGSHRKGRWPLVEMRIEKVVVPAHQTKGSIRYRTDDVQANRVVQTHKSMLSCCLNAIVAHLSALKTTQRNQMTLDLATAIIFCRDLNASFQCRIVQRLWGEASALDLATVAVTYMSDTAIKYVQGLSKAGAVETAMSHGAPGIYELLVDCDDTRAARYIGKSDHGVHQRMICHRSSNRRGKKNALYTARRAFEERPFFEILLVGLPTSDLDWFRRLGKALCPAQSADKDSLCEPQGLLHETYTNISSKLLSVEVNRGAAVPSADEFVVSMAIKLALTSIFEAAFIALRRTWRGSVTYHEPDCDLFGIQEDVLPLKSTPGTESRLLRSLSSDRKWFAPNWKPSIELLKAN